MNLDFDINSVRTTEFGVGADDGHTEKFCCVPVDGDVQDALREMTTGTWDAMRNLATAPLRYEPAEKHASAEYVYLPVNDDLSRRMRELHQASNLSIDSAALSNPAALFCYFARMTDSRSRRLTALRRATLFKGVLKSRLVRLATDTLKLVEDRVFKLDSDFDLLVDSRNVHILRPSAFEFVGKLQGAILAAVSQNITELQGTLPFVNFAGIQEYASKHPRAARLLAAIRAQSETSNIDKSALKKLCKTTGVDIHESRGTITIPDGHVIGFLEVLDRRRYELELVNGAPERFKAASRQKLGA